MARKKTDRRFEFLRLHLGALPLYQITGKEYERRLSGKQRVHHRRKRVVDVVDVLAGVQRSRAGSLPRELPLSRNPRIVRVSDYRERERRGDRVKWRVQSRFRQILA